LRHGWWFRALARSGVERPFFRLIAIHRHFSQGAGLGLSLAVPLFVGRHFEKGDERVFQSRYNLFTLTDDPMPKTRLRALALTLLALGLPLAGL
jgi:hypothetical protein